MTSMNEVANSAESTSSKRPGLPRKDGHDEKIIDATLRLIDSNRPVTVNAVVKESGVARAAVYRRWPRLVDLVAEALDAGRAPVEIDTSGDIKETLIDGLFTNQAKTTGVSYPRQRFRKRLELVMSDQELQLAYWNSHVRRRREASIRALQVAQEKG
nr:helix-turn-helix domain-containing protein [Corynebacterium glutamicum]